MSNKYLKSLIAMLPGIRSLAAERNELKAIVADLRKELSAWRKGFVPPGHFYSPIPDPDEVRRNRARVFERQPTNIPGINLNTDNQLIQLETFESYCSECPFPEEPADGFRYHLNNPYYAYSDGVCLYSMLRHLRPNRFIEVGSGFSSAAALDTDDLFLGKTINFTFIDPNPERLEQLLTSDDKKNPKIEIFRSIAQEIPLDVFSSLQPRDILFIDSTHVSRVGSDVNYLFFEVFPALPTDTYIHIHDVFFPFEYPEEWIYGGRAWNELYLLRAFLQFNADFEIVFFNNYLEKTFRSTIELKMPLCLKRPNSKMTVPGGIWLHKIRPD